jgi:hypothetical protein
MARMIDMAVDGIISDLPNILRRVAGEKGVAFADWIARYAVALAVRPRG